MNTGDRMKRPKILPVMIEKLFFTPKFYELLFSRISWLILLIQSFQFRNFSRQKCHSIAKSLIMINFLCYCLCLCLIPCAIAGIQFGWVHFRLFSTSHFVPPALSSDWTWPALSSVVRNLSSAILEVLIFRYSRVVPNDWKWWFFVTHGGVPTDWKWWFFVGHGGSQLTF